MLAMNGYGCILTQCFSFLQEIEIVSTLQLWYGSSHVTAQTQNEMQKHLWWQNAESLTLLLQQVLFVLDQMLTARSPQHSSL